MMMVRELTEQEIFDAAATCKLQYYDWGWELEFAKALFEAARVQQTQEREPNVHS
jgi:hypothetical protein